MAAAESDRLVLVVRLTPKAAVDRIDGWASDQAGRPYLNVRVRAQPIEGRANAALEALLAQALGTSKSRVSVERGAAQRLKRVVLDGVDAAAAAAAFGPPPENEI